MAQKAVVLVDDDSVLVNAMKDEIRMFLSQYGIGLFLCTSPGDFDNGLPRKDDCEIVIGIIDLWMVDKLTNTSDHNAGMNLISKVRAQWPHSYIIVYSGHITSLVEQELQKLPQIAIIEKPLATSRLVTVLADLLEGFGICRISG